MSSAPLPSTAPRPAALLWLGAVAGCLALLFGPTVAGLWQRWASDPNYSHGFFVLPVSATFAWLYLRGAGRPRDGDAVLGCLSVLAGSLLHLAAVVIAVPLLDFAGLALVLRGVAVAAGGREWARGLTFPILFLFFMFPLPGLWTAQAAVWLQDVVSRASAVLLDLFFVCYRQGNALHVAGLPGPLFVAEECSGLRQLVAFFALGAILGRWWLAPWPARLLLLAAAVPVAVAANVLRVLLMAFGARLFGVGWLSGWLHDAPALVSLLLGLALYLPLAAALGAPRENAQPRPTSPERQRRDRPDTSPKRKRGDPLACASGWCASAVVCCLALAVAAQWALWRHLEGPNPAPPPSLRAALADVPLTLLPDEDGPAWRGGEHPLRAALAKQVPFADEFIYRVYQPGRSGPAVALYAVYSQQGKDRKHHPEVCMRDAAGAPEDPDARKVVHLDGARQRAVQRFRFHTGTGQHAVVYYWHYTLPLDRPQHESFLQELHRRIARPAPSVTVQVTTNAPLDELERVEKSFLVALDAALVKDQLPATVTIGCDRVPITVIRP